MAGRVLALALLAASSAAHGGGGRDASDNVPQLADAAALADLVSRAAASNSAAFVRFYMNG